ncbi:hypothetical protein P154DRAFT_339796 [Amniculicola lignicola CBS 123094]|uniref:Uncharacterized protein n=1 Tax=Amniculicola lignicola CBS 123094 TaxID=1392246 RepID=A0A6A5W6E8_9PLEO|nr:hypothetical protein P154DRAFT_339796 [Amniculicola lignicola CBS 123094]
MVSQTQNAGQASGIEMAWMARWAEVDKLESILCDCLFKGIKASRMRKGEENRKLTKLTDTVRLHLLRKEGEDFKLEV